MKDLEKKEEIMAALEAIGRNLSWGVVDRLRVAIDELEKDQFRTGSEDDYNWETKAIVSHGEWEITGRCGYGSYGKIEVSKHDWRVTLQTCGGHCIELYKFGGFKSIEVLDVDNIVSYTSWGDEANGLKGEDLKEARKAAVKQWLVKK